MLVGRYQMSSRAGSALIAMLIVMAWGFFGLVTGC